MSEKTFEKLTALLVQNQARYRVVEHSSAGKSEDVAKIRGTQIGQGAKALVCTLKGNGVKQTIRLLVFMRICCSLLIRVYYNVMMNWHLTQVRSNVR